MTEAVKVVEEQGRAELPDELKADGIRERADRIADLAFELTELKLEYKEVRQRWRIKIKDKEALASKLGDERSHGAIRTIQDCVIVRDYANHKIKWMVGGKLKEQRAMTAEEKDREDVDLQTTMLVSNDQTDPVENLSAVE